MAADIEVPFPIPKRILAIDPGGRSGVAVYVREEFEFRLTGAWEVVGHVRAISDTISRFLNGGPGVLVVERQFFRTNGPKVQLKGIETLLRHRHEWQVIAEVFGVPHVLVYPASWQSKMLPKKDGPDDDTKSRALRSCSLRWPERDSLWADHEDARDAALIGRFYADRVEEKVLR